MSFGYAHSRACIVSNSRHPHTQLQKKAFWVEHSRSYLCIPRIELKWDVSLKNQNGSKGIVLVGLVWHGWFFSVVSNSSPCDMWNQHTDSGYLSVILLQIPDIRICMWSSIRVITESWFRLGVTSDYLVQTPAQSRATWELHQAIDVVSGQVWTSARIKSPYLQHLIQCSTIPMINPFSPLLILYWNISCCGLCLLLLFVLLCTCWKSMVPSLYLPFRCTYCNGSKEGRIEAWKGKI